MEGTTSGGPKHLDHHPVHFAPLFLLRPFSRVPVLNAKARTNLTEALLISTGFTHAVSKTQSWALTKSVVRRFLRLLTFSPRSVVREGHDM
jgi:hypothetical protein